MKDIIQFVDYNLKIENKGTWYHILKNLNFTIKKGEITSIIGASGSGKSMTLNAIMQLFENLKSYEQSGQIIFQDKEGHPDEVTSVSMGRLHKIRQDLMGMTFQQSALILNPSLTIFQQLSERLLRQRKSKEEVRKHCEETMLKVGLRNVDEILRKYPHQLSGGQIQRVLIAMGIIHNPEILLIDEPTSALDSSLKVEILELIKMLKADYNLTIVLVSHNLELIAQYSDHIVVLDKGQIAEYGAPDKLFHSPESEVTRALLNTNDAALSERREMSESPILELSDITLRFALKTAFFKKSHLTILNGFNLSIPKASIIGLVGISGSGKSTIAKVALGLLMPERGDVLYNGESIYNLSKSNYAVYRKNVQIIFQDPLSSLSPHRTGRQVLEEASQAAGARYSEDKMIALLGEVSLQKSVLNKVPRQLSGGQRQRLLIARALIMAPQLLVCDEILASLDTVVKYQIIQLLKDINQKHTMAILFISHDIDMVNSICDKVYPMHLEDQPI